MLDKARPDVVVIGQRWLDQHRDMAIAATERGIHVYMEKPFCRTLAEADEIVDACERTHVKLAIAHPTRYSPKLQTVKRLIAEGKIGKVLEYRGRGKEDRRGGGEDLWVLGTHVMDMIRALAGHPTWCFGRVTQSGRPVTKGDVTEGNEGIGPLAGDAVTALFGLGDGATAYFQSVRNMAGKGSRYGLQVYGSAGVFEILEGTLPSVKYLGDPSWSPGRSKAAWQDVSSTGIGEPEPLTDDAAKNRHRPAAIDLLQAVEENRQPASSAYEARGATEMIVAVFESHRVGGPVDLPLENRQNPLTMLG
jgi:predicted dehydrogenase